MRNSALARCAAVQITGVSRRFIDGRANLEDVVGRLAWGLEINMTRRKTPTQQHFVRFLIFVFSRQRGANFTPPRERDQDIAADEGFVRGDSAADVGYPLEGRGGTVLAVAAQRGFAFCRVGGP